MKIIERSDPRDPVDECERHVSEYDRALSEKSGFICGRTGYRDDTFRIYDPGLGQ